jgi:hypothetical protein
MADAVRFSIVLEDKLSGSAGAASKALAQVEKKLSDTSAALAQVEKGGKSGGLGLDALMKAGKAGIGPMGGLFEKAELLKGAIGAGGLAAAGIAAAAAIVALTAAAVAGAVALSGMAVAAADAARTESILAEGLTGSAAAGKAYEGAIRSAVMSTGVARDSVGKYARALYDAGVRGAALGQSVKAAAQSAAVLGDEGAQAFIKTASDAAKAGQAVDKLAADVDAKLGGLAARRMMSLDALAVRLKESIGGLVAGLNIEPLLAGLSRLVDLFGENTAAGQAIGFLVGKAMQAVSDAAAGAVPLVERLFKMAIILGLQAYIAMAPVVRTFADFAARLASMLPIGLMFKAVLGTLAAGLAALAIPIAVQVTSFLAIWSAIGLVTTRLGELWSTFKAIDWSQLASSMIDGLVNGITAGVDRVVSAARDLAGKVTTGVKAALGIASPSKVFAELGKFTAEGFTVGVESEAPAVTAATSAMVAPPTLGAASAAGSAAGASTATPSAGSGGATFAGSVTINISGIPGVNELEARLPEMLASAFEAIGLSIGAAPAASPVAAGA